MQKILIVGAGFSGAVIAHSLADAGYQCHVIDERDHIGGNCYTKIDEQTGIMVHAYGPHIFHTNNRIIWDYIRQFDEFMPYTHRAKTLYNGQVYSLPMNLHTISQFFGRYFTPKEARKYIESLADKTINEPKNLEQQALKFMGRDLYEAFFQSYTEKQWGIHPSKLPADILKRLPIRFTFDDSYHHSQFSGIPKNGYTKIFEIMLNHENITLELNRPYQHSMRSHYDYTFYTGTLDGFYDYRLGALKYRSLKFESEYHKGDYQGCPVLNYPESQYEWTRITEHKYFEYWKNNTNTIIYKEYSHNWQKGDTPYYPLRLSDDMDLLAQYQKLAANEANIQFVGRLGSYQYIDMHQAIEQAIKAAEGFIVRNYYS